jgi:HSP20 family protein
MSISQRRTGDHVMRNRHHEYDAFATDPLLALVDTFFSGDRGTHMANRLSGWAGDIKVDATETKDAFLISADLPGIRKEDMKVSLSRDRILTIEAERKEESSGEDSERSIHWKERTFGKMHRSFRLNRSANPEDYGCKFDNGVLTIRIGKREPRSDVSYLTIE